MQPLPRFRIYSRPSDYWAIARDVATRRWLEGDGCRERETCNLDPAEVERCIDSETPPCS